MKKNTYFIVFLFVWVALNESHAQEYFFGFKGGPTLAVQRWESYQRGPLFAYHGAAFLESLPSDNAGSSFFCEIGYHQRGSAERFHATQYQLPGGGIYNSPAATYSYRFHNIGLVLGARKNYETPSGKLYYYKFGFRGDYTVDVKFPYENAKNPYYPQKGFVRRVNYGVFLGGGKEFTYTEALTPFLEFSLSPDFSRQYYAPPIPNVRDPYSGGIYTIPEQKVFNVSLEVSIGIKFLRKVIYE
jgi:hypothetical protein